MHHCIDDTRKSTHNKFRMAEALGTLSTACYCTLLPLFLLLLAANFAGCAKSIPPVTRAWRPWTRVLANPQGVEAGGVLGLDVTGNTDPLLGSEYLLAADIEMEARQLLERRGFRVEEDAAGYSSTLSFQTTRSESAVSSSASRAGLVSTGWTSSSQMNTAGLGVKVARTIGMGGAVVHETMASIRTPLERYEHTLAMEIMSPEEQLMWKGEATWITRDPACQYQVRHLYFSI